LLIRVIAMPAGNFAAKTGRADMYRQVENLAGRSFYSNDLHPKPTVFP
jgi:hypothetical protein